MGEGGLRVPCIIRWPAKVPAGKTNDEFLTSLAILPTVADATEAKRDERIVLDGFNMLPVLQGDTNSTRESMFWQRRNHQAARVGDWKWISLAGKQSLFDLSKDVSEEHDLADERPEVLQQMRAHFASWRKEMDATEPRGPFRDY